MEAELALACSGDFVGSEPASPFPVLVGQCVESRFMLPFSAQ